MNKTVRHMVITSILFSIFFNHSVRVQAASKDNQIELNQQLQWGINPIIKKDTALVPVRSIGTLLGADVHWDAPTETIKISQGTVTNTLRLNETIAYKEDEHGKTKIQLALPPLVKNGITYVPLRYIAESFDVKVSWDPKTNTVKMMEFLEYNNQKIFLDDSTEQIIGLLGQPSFTMTDEAYEYLFYVDDYENVLVLFSTNHIIVGFTTTAKTMKFRDVTYNGKRNDNIANLTTIKDSHDGDKVVGMGSSMNRKNPTTKASLLANERIIFELTNGFRAHHNIASLKYNDKLSDVARKHSQDMADKDYFSHTSMDGTSLSERINRSGIKWSRCRENIAADHRTELATFDQWLNSLEYRENMLQSTGDVGIGSAYNGSSMYGYYHTQNFASIP